MTIKVYYTAAEAYDEPDTDLLFKITAFDGDCFTVEIKTVLHKGNLEVLDSIKQTILEMDT